MTKQRSLVISAVLWVASAALMDFILHWHVPALIAAFAGGCCAAAAISHDAVDALEQRIKGLERLQRMHELQARNKSSFWAHRRNEPWER